MTGPGYCPRCESPDPFRHPAMQFEGEVQICPHPFHAVGERARVAAEKLPTVGRWNSSAEEPSGGAAALRADVVAVVLEEVQALRRVAGEYGDACEEYGAVRTLSSPVKRGPALELTEVAWAAVIERLDRMETAVRGVEQR